MPSLDRELARRTTRGKGLFHSVVAALYPPLCVACGEETQSEMGLCSACFTDTYFITSAFCDVCSVPLPGQEPAPDLVCDTCLKRPPVWQRGRAAVVYEGAGRRIALALKHGDRLDVAGPVAGWMERAAGDLIKDSELVVPVPLHWSRLLNRKFNQAAEIARNISRKSNLPFVSQAVMRHRRTQMQRGMTRDERLENQRAAIAPHPRYGSLLEGKKVLLIDDVLTTGATLSATAEACFQAGASNVNVLVFARVARVD